MAARSEPDPYGEILRGIADARVDEAAAGRARAHWLGRMAEDEGTLAGALADLVERAAPVRLRARGALELTGVPSGLGADVVAIRDATGLVLVRIDRVVTVRTDPSLAAPTRRAGPGQDRRGLHEVLVDAAAERRAVAVHTDDGATLQGELRAVGTDVLTLRMGDRPVVTVLVSFDAVIAVRLLDER